MYSRRLLALLLTPFLAIPGNSRLHLCLRALACEAACDSCPDETNPRTNPDAAGGHAHRSCCPDSTSEAPDSGLEQDADDGVPCGCCVELASSPLDAATLRPDPVPCGADLCAADVAPFQLPPPARPALPRPPRPPPPPVPRTYAPLLI